MCSKCSPVCGGCCELKAEEQLRRNLILTEETSVNKWRPNHRFFSSLAVVLIGITFYLAMSNLDLVHGALKTVLDVLAPFIWGFVVAYLLDARCAGLKETGWPANSEHSDQLSAGGCRAGGAAQLRNSPAGAEREHAHQQCFGVPEQPERSGEQLGQPAEHRSGGYLRHAGFLRRSDESGHPAGYKVLCRKSSITAWRWAAA